MSFDGPELFGYAGVERPICRRARTTNRPLSRVRRDTREGRRRADLFLAFMNTLGNPIDPGLQADVLRCAELAVAAEIARSKMLSDPDSCNIDNLSVLTRFENLLARAMRELGLDRKRTTEDAAPSLESYLANRAPTTPAAVSDLDEVDQ